MAQNCVRRPMMMMLNSDKNNSKTRKVYRASIEHASGRKNIADSGYFRLLIASNPNNDSYNDIKKDIAKLVSKIHSASIINGNILVTEYIANHIYNSNLPKYRDIPITHIDELCEGHYMHLKFYINGKNIEVDYTIVDIEDDTIYIQLFEIKDGGEMDTKKADSEVRSLLEIEDMLQDSNNLLYKYVVIKPYIVLWNTYKITKGSFKASLSSVYLITGKQMCIIVGGMDFDTITRDRTDIGPDNLSYIIRQFKTIVYKYDMINEQLDKLP